MADKEFYKHILHKQQMTASIPANKEIAAWALQVIRLMYPEQSNKLYAFVEQLEADFARLENELCALLDATRGTHEENKELARQFFESLPEMYRLLNTDVQATFAGDPAAKSEFEVIRAYPGFFAITFYRMSHSLYKLGVPILPRILTEYAHSRTGIDIHPAADIADHFYIDHGTGVVIGETCIIGRHVKIYQGVTLGALSVTKKQQHTKRHPTVEDHAVIYAGATILGGKTVIGEGSIIGGNVWLTKSVPAYSKVYHTHEVSLLKEKIKE
ncbi:MAG TPA: serine O-acetyltransferase EpsC [Mucilaginibacter sp.]|nr:serine O-acetyltransferase EpsC [Mucilaginibacter sp.]